MKGGALAVRIDTITSGGFMQVQAAAAVPERRTVQLTASEAAEAARTGRADTLTLSEDAKKALDKLSREVDKQNEAAAMTYNMKQELENSKKASKAAADDASYKLKMLEIARRLQNGDRVPGKDEKALMEYDDKLYQVSKQIGMMKENTKGKEGAERIKGYGINLLDKNAFFPKREGGLDAIWMSQFLDCFSEEEIVSILTRAKAVMDADTRIFIMATLWDRQRFETAAFCLTMTSLYFTAMANGNSKMYHSEDMTRLVNEAGLEVEHIYDGLGQCHSIMVCKLRKE